MTKNRSTAEGRKAFIDELKAKQRNTVWPDPLVNSRGVDEFFWKGSPDAPLIQRIGAWLFGLFFLAGGLSLLMIARERRSWLVLMMSAAGFLLGARVFFNGFRRGRAKAKHS
jgi:hypothetical protein